MIEINHSPRAIAIASLGCIAAGVLACGTEPTVMVTAEPPTAPVVVGSPPTAIGVAAPAPAAAAAPAHGGTVVMAGSYPVEVVPHESGQVYAYVLGDAPPPDGTELTVVVPVTGGVRAVELAWEPGETRWGGRVRRSEIVPGPIDVVLVAGGARYTGHVVTFVVLPAIVVVETSPSVVVIEDDHHDHHKHRKHRGHHVHWH